MLIGLSKPTTSLKPPVWMSQNLSILLKTGQIVLITSTKSEIKLTVDLVGLSEPPMPSTTEDVLPENLMLLNYFLKPTPADVVDFYLVSLWDVTEDKLEPHGTGSKTPESLPEEISELLDSVMITPCHNVLIILTQPPKDPIALKSNKLTQFVDLLAQMTQASLTLPIKKKLPPATD